MTIALDLPTILFVLQTSYFAGALALAYARYRSPDAAGAEKLALGFLLLAGGAMLASYAEQDSALYSLLSLANISLGAFAYALFLAGAVELSRRRPIRPGWVVLLPPLLTIAAGVATGFHVVNWLRAILFNCLAAVSMLTAAWVFYRDGRNEPLPARRIVTLTFLATGLLSLMMAAEFGIGEFWPTPALPFVCLLSLKFALALAVMILTMERAMAKLDHLAHTDVLTGLSNRRFFFATAPISTKVGDAVVIFDADRFKKLNDSWGHAIGDEALRAMARALSTHIRSGDILARHGGEEFILFLPGAGEAQALAIADRMRAEVEATAIAGSNVRATVSAGIAVATDSGVPLQQLIHEADAALYDAKAAGRNVCRVGGQAERRSA